MNTATFDTKKVLPQVKKVELREEGAVITLAEGQTIFLDQDQICKVWGMLTMALDCACFGELSSKVRRLGISKVMLNAIHGIKMLTNENENQTEFDLIVESTNEQR